MGANSLVGRLGQGALARAVRAGVVLAWVCAASAGCLNDWDKYDEVEATDTADASDASGGDDVAEGDVASGGDDVGEGDVGGGEDADAGAPDVGDDAALDAAPDVDDDAGAEDVDTPDADEPDADEPDADEPDVPEEDAGAQLCATFRVTQDAYFLQRFYSVTIEAEGGSGQYRWSFVDGESASDGLIDPGLGLYLAGGDTGTVDRIRVEDVVCEIHEDVEVFVVEDASLRPVQAEVQKGQAFCFEVVGGSSQAALPPDEAADAIRWERVQSGTGEGGSIDQEGCYVAGQVDGEDVIQATDTLTGQTMTAVVRAREEAPVVRAASPPSVVPAGETMEVRFEGGSYVYDFILELEGADGTTVDVNARALNVAQVQAGLEGGRGTLRAVDVFFPELSAEVDVSVMERVEFPVVPYGMPNDNHDLEMVGDVNGDGFEDAMLGARQFALNGDDSGAAYLFLGGPPDADGVAFARTPSQVIPGVRRDHYLGHAITHGDYNGDGCEDVALGAFGGNQRGTETGDVQIWLGCRGDRPAPELDDFGWNGRLEDNVGGLGEGPLRLWRTYVGDGGGDRLGWALATADVDNDGRDDLIATAPQFDDPALDGSNQGQVVIYTHAPEGGLGEEPAMVFSGRFMDDEGAIVSANNLRMGYSVASADVTGDGCAEVLLGAAQHNSNRGLVALYASRPDPEAPGGCALETTTPALTVDIDRDANDDGRAGYLGWYVGFADLTGDCVPDPIVTQLQVPRLDDGSPSAAGAVNVIEGDPSWSADAPSRMVRTEAAFILEGDRWDQVGLSFATGDFNGDGRRDLLAGSRFAESEGTQGDVGEVRILYGRADSAGCSGPPEDDLGLFEEPVLVVNEGTRRQDQFGARVIAAPDMDGDGADDLLIFAPRGPGGEDALNVLDHQGALYWLSSQAETYDFAALERLTFPTPKVFDQLGWALEPVGDINGDGWVDMLSGAPYWDYPTVLGDGADYVRSSSGAAFVHLGRPDGVPGAPDAVLGGHLHHTESDLMGYALTSGDFDGDGARDLIVGAPLEDNGGGTLCNPCRTGGNNDPGMILIYRGGPDLLTPDATVGGLPAIQTPDAVVCGPSVSDIELGRTLRSGFDANNDGFDDLLIGGWAWNSSRGQVWYLPGQTIAEGDVQRFCLEEDTHQVWAGTNSGDNLGRGIATADVDGDGCDDLIAGAVNGDPPGLSNTGQLFVRLMPGLGCRAETFDVQLHTGRNNDNIGWRLATGDFDGDGATDLAVTSSGYGSSNLGVVLVYSGQALRNLLAGAQDGDILTLSDPDVGPPIVLAELNDPTGAANDNYGLGLQANGDLNDDGYDDIIIGSQLSSLSGVERSGGAFVFFGSPDPAQFAEVDVLLGGESERADGRFGFSVAASLRRVDDPSAGAFVAAGAYLSDPLGPEQSDLGAVFIAPLPVPADE